MTINVAISAREGQRPTTRRGVAVVLKVEPQSSLRMPGGGSSSDCVHLIGDLLSRRVDISEQGETGLVNIEVNRGAVRDLPTPKVLFAPPPQPGAFVP